MTKSRKRGHRNRGGRPRIHPPKLVIPREENEAKFAAFREGIQAGNSAAELCKHLKISKDTSTNWLGHVKAQALMALDAFGLNELTVAQDLAYCRRSRNYKIRLDTAKEIGKMRGMYPPPPEPAHPPAVELYFHLQLPEKRPPKGEIPPGATRHITVQSGKAGERRRDQE
jgi:hypothetical protein